MGKRFELETPAGTIIAEVELIPKEETGRSYHEVYLSIKPDGYDDYQDIACLRAVDGTKDFELMVWGDSADESYTDKYVFDRETLEKVRTYEE